MRETGCGKSRTIRTPLSSSVPWEPPAAKFTASQLPTRKSQCTTRELRQYTLMAVVQVSELNAAVYFNNGSVDPYSERTGVDFVTGKRVRYKRTSEQCSTLQTKLVAILQALDRA